MPSTSDIASQIVATLGVTEPDLDTSVGTTVRKIIDASSAQISNAYADNNISASSTNINNLSGTALDNYVANFGMARLPAKYATGLVLFSRPPVTSVGALPDVTIQGGTVVATTDVNPISFSVSLTAVLPSADNTIDVPVIAVAPGLAGNVASGAISVISTPVVGLGSVTNPLAMSGGADPESDAALRTRFQQTNFRGYTGTVQNLTGTAIENAAVSRVNTLGARSTTTVQVQVSGGTANTLPVVYPHIYSDNMFFGSSIADGNFLNQTSQWTPTITASGSNYYVSIAVDTTTVPDGIYELQYDYLSAFSRCSVANGALNYVDIWTDGSDIQSASETLPFGVGTGAPTSPAFTTTTTSLYYTENWVRSDGVTQPQAGNLFIPLTFTPPISLPSQLSDGTHTYTLGIDYVLVYYTGAYSGLQGQGWSPHSLAGIEWTSTDDWGSPGAFTMGVTYDYNAVPTEVETAIAGQRLAGSQNVWAHQANAMYLDFAFVVVLVQGYTVSSVLPGIESALSALCQSIYFGGTLETSALIGAVISVNGVQAARMATGAVSSTELGDCATTVTAASNGVALSAASTLNVVSTANFPTSGVVAVYSGTSPLTWMGNIAYTGLTPTTLTGCAVLSGSGTLATGNVVQGPWSIQQVSGAINATTPVSGNIIQTFPNRSDVSFNEVSYPVFNTVNVVVRSQNTFRSYETD